MDLIYEGITTTGPYPFPDLLDPRQNGPDLRRDYDLYASSLVRLRGRQNGPDLRRDYDPRTSSSEGGST